MLAHAAAPAGAREFLPGSVPRQPAPVEGLAAPQRMQVQRVQSRRGIPHEDMTRYLSAAVTFNSDLAKNVIENILEEPYRAIAVTPGVDLVTVLKYALAENRRRIIRDTLLLIYLSIMIITVLVGFITIPLFVFTIPLFLFISWMTILSERYTRFYGQSSQPLRPGQFDTAAPRSPASNSYRAQQLARVERAHSSGNATIYSAFSPFVGYGLITSSWSFVVDVTSPRSNATPRPFTVQQLYDHVEAGLAELDLPGMEFSERLFVNGHDIHGDPRFLSAQDGPPAISVGQDLLTHLIASPEERARPYLAISVAGWQGDLVTTTFVRFLLSRTDLFVEAARTAVAPLREEFRAVDELERGPVEGEFRALLGQSFRQTIPLVLRSGSAILYELRRSGRREKKKRRHARKPDYGALISVREVAADTNWQRYFQVFDNARYSKVIEQRIFRSLIEFLEAHDVDTSSLVERAEVLINNGVHISGNATVQAEQIAGGPAANATKWAARLRGRDGGGEAAT
jgi:hypothetical protein